VTNQKIEFDSNGWQVEKLPGGLMQITGRSPHNIRHALFEIATVEEEPGKPTIAINTDGQRYELIKAEDRSPGS
jgi:hypothetical protein